MPQAPSKASPASTHFRVHRGTVGVGVKICRHCHATAFPEVPESEFPHHAGCPMLDLPRDREVPDVATSDDPGGYDEAMEELECRDAERGVITVAYPRNDPVFILPDRGFLRDAVACRNGMGC